MSRRLQLSSRDQQEGPPQLRHLISVESMEGVIEALKKAYPFYGLLLPSPQNSQINEYIRTKWERLSAMSGRGCLLLTTLVPERPTREMQILLERLVGKKNGQTLWERYHYSPEQVANGAFLLAQEAKIDLDRLPCLVLMTALDSGQRLIHRLPDWDAASLEHLFTALFTKVNHHLEEADPANRLSGLEQELGKAFFARLQARHTVQSFHDKLVELNWVEIIQSTLTNQELIANVFRLLAAHYGGPV